MRVSRRRKQHINADRISDKNLRAPISSILQFDFILPKPVRNGVNFHRNSIHFQNKQTQIRFHPAHFSLNIIKIFIIPIKSLRNPSKPLPPPWSPKTQLLHQRLNPCLFINLRLSNSELNVQNFFKIQQFKKNFRNSRQLDLAQI